MKDVELQLRNDRRDIIREINLLMFSDGEWADDSLKKFSSIIDTVNTFRLNVNRIVTDKQLDRPSQVNKLMAEHKVEKFCGWAESQVVHEFVKQICALFSMAGLNKDKDKALMLYTKYLSPEVQVQVSEYKHDYENLIRKLIITFGDPKRVLGIQMETLRNIKAPNKDDMKSEVFFLAKFNANLKKVKQLVDSLGSDGTILSAEFYRASSFDAILTIFGTHSRKYYDEFLEKTLRPMRNQERIKGVNYSYGQLYKAFIDYLDEVEHYIQNCIDMRSGNQLLGRAKPKWTDPLSDQAVKSDERKPTLSNNQISHLNTFLTKKAEQKKVHCAGRKYC